MRRFASATLLLAAALATGVAASHAALGPCYGGQLTLAVAPFGPTRPRVAAGASERLAIGLLHDTLVRLAPDGGLHPSLARAWTTSADGREWSVSLDPHARFHDGAPVTATSAAASLRRFLRSSSAAAESLARSLDGGAAFREGGSAELPGVSVPDEARLVLRLASPSSVLLHALTSPAAAIVDAAGGGAGPFAPVLEVPGRRLVAHAHPGHVRGRPFLDRVLLLAGGAEPDARFADAGAPATAATLLLALDASRAPFDSADARAAVRSSIDREDLARRLIPGGLPRFGLLEDFTAASRDDAATSPQPKPRLSGSLRLFVDDAVPPAVSQRIVAWLASLGLRSEIRVGASGEAARSDASARLLLYLPEVFEPALVLREALALAGASSLRAALDRADAETDAPRRRELLREIERGLLAERALIPLASLPLGVAAREGVHGLRFDAASRLSLEDAWLSPR